MKVLVFAGLTVGWVMAEADGTTTLIIDLITNGGIAGVLFYFLLGERKERVESQKANKDLQDLRLSDMKETLPLLRDIAKGQDEVAAALRATVRQQAQMPEDRALDRYGLAHAVEALTRGQNELATKLDELASHERRES